MPLDPGERSNLYRVTFGPVDRLAVTRLLTEWVNKSASIMHERSGNFRASAQRIETEARDHAHAIGLAWDDSFIEAIADYLTDEEES